MRFTFDTKKIARLKQDGQRIVIDPTAEASLMDLLGLQQTIAEALEAIKEEMVATGLKMNPNFTGARSDLLKIQYRKYGQLFKINKKFKTTKQFREVPVREISRRFRKTVQYRPSSQTIREYFDANGRLPSGVVKCKRPSKMSITVKDSDQLLLWSSKFEEEPSKNEAQS